MRSKTSIEHQIQILVNQVDQWYASGQKDRGLEQAVKHSVFLQLLGRQSMQVLVGALGMLEEPQAQCLQKIINECSQSFVRTDSQWNAFAVPIAYQWKMKRERMFVARRGLAPQLEQLATGIRQCSGALKVVIDERLYTGTALYQLEVGKLYQHLQSLVLKAPGLTPPLAHIQLRSCDEPQWRMAYLLGVEVTPPNARKQLGSPGVQVALQDYLHHAVDALIAPDRGLFDQGAQGPTACHPPLYLHDALRQGARALQGHRLAHHITELSKASNKISLNYTYEPVPGSYRLLLQAGWLAYEMRWSIPQGEDSNLLTKQIREVIAELHGVFSVQFVALDTAGYMARHEVTGLAAMQRSMR